jgi:hypothetical protein
MQGYRVYVLGSNGHVDGRVEFFCPDDETAKERAKQLINGRDIELWLSDQRIACFESRSGSPRV